MTEILTESFCERCGTRYTFESSAPRKSRVGRVKVFSKGVRNFVMTDDSSFSEAMAEARSAEELVATTHQLDAFHQTFNFCLDCRQYTCGSCWNTHEGRCLTCAPDPTLEAAAAMPETVAVAEAIPAGEAASAGESLPADAWPETDVPVDRLARVVGDPVPADGIVPAAAVDAPETEAEAVEATQDAEAIARAAALVAASDVAPDEPESADVARVKGLVPGQSLEEAIAAWEAQQVANDAAAEPELEPVAAAEPELEPVAAAEPEPRADDVVQQPTWPVAATPPQAPAPAPPTAPAPPGPAPWLTVAPDDGSPVPQWPTTPAWPTTGTHLGSPTTLAGRPLVPQGDASALWAASAREVLSAAPVAMPTAAAAPTAQPCIGCGLPLSANARFCRRCGTRQV